MSNVSERKIFLLCTITLCSLAIPYRMYLISQGYEYGLANFDMQLYTTMAEETKNLGILESFAAMSNNWTFAQVNLLQIWGYRFYVLFLKYSIYKWTVLPVVYSVYLVSIWQLLLALYSMLVVYNSIKKDHIIYNNLSLFLMLMAPPIWYGCVRLLRETYMLYCIAATIRVLCRREQHRGIKILLYLVILTIFRPYYTLFMIPLLLLLGGRERISLAIEGGIFIGLAAICIVQKVGILDVLGVILSPNFYNQTKAVWEDAFKIHEATGQIQFINFIGSLWNAVVVIYAVLSLTIVRHLSIKSWCNFGVILDLCMLYAIAYGGTTELRHKMFFVIPLIIILNDSKFAVLENVNGNGSEISKNAFIVSFCLGILLICSILIIGLIW